jgi:RNA polymerase sigma-70 factor, ECF subfamily
VLDGEANEVIRRACAGDRQAFGQLVAEHYDRIYRLAWRFAGTRDRAEDIAQDVVVKLAGAIRGFRGDAAFSTWLFRLVYTTATDSLRRGQKLHLVDPVKLAEMTETADTETPETHQLGRELWAAVRALPPQQRDAVTLVYGEDMNHADAAKIMGCTEKTVSWHLHEAKKRLRTQLEAA